MRVFLAAAVVALVFAGSPARQSAAVASQETFAGRIAALSEPSGYFQSDNLVGNERPLQQVVPALKAMKRGGAYLGVAPDQNFSYFVALFPLFFRSGMSLCAVAPWSTACASDPSARTALTYATTSSSLCTA